MYQYTAREFDLSHVEGLSARAIELHLGLYKGYVQKVNELLGGDAQHNADQRARRMGFEWNGMVLHELFFEALRGPGSQIDERGVFAEALDESFGGFDAWRRDLAELAGLRGIGWVATVRDPATSRLFNVWIEEHHLGTPAGVQSVLLVDLWEHAWVLDFQPAQRSAYFDTILKNIDWAIVDERCRVSGA